MTRHQDRAQYRAIHTPAPQLASRLLCSVSRKKKMSWYLQEIMPGNSLPHLVNNCLSFQRCRISLISYLISDLTIWKHLPSTYCSVFSKYSFSKIRASYPSPFSPLPLLLAPSKSGELNRDYSLWRGNLRLYERYEPHPPIPRGKPLSWTFHKDPPLSFILIFSSCSVFLTVESFFCSEYFF